jgi:hypothetical protein
VKRRIILRFLDEDQGRTPPMSMCLLWSAFMARSIPMMDIVMLAIGFVFFALSIGYVYGCDRL